MYIGRHQFLRDLKLFKGTIRIVQLSVIEADVCVDLRRELIELLCSEEILESVLILLLLHKDVSNAPETLVVPIVVH